LSTSPRDAQILQRALDAGVAPNLDSRSPSSRPSGESLQARGPSTPTRLVRPLSGDERPVPANNRIGRDNRRHVDQNLATETGAEDSQPPPFVVGEPHALAAELRFQDTIFFAQVLNDLGQAALEPADEKRDEPLQRNHAVSLRQLSAEFLDTTGSCDDTRETYAMTGDLPSAIVGVSGAVVTQACRRAP
jgi:hypothetical protein